MGHASHPDPLGFELEGVDPLSASVFRSWRTTDKLNRLLFMRTLAERGGHPGQAMCLWMLSMHEGMSQRDLAERMHLTPPTVTAMMQKMERHGLVERRTDEHDQRLTRLTLTDAGREMAVEMRTAQAGYVNETVGALSEDDRREFGRLLDILADSIGEALKRFGDSPGAWYHPHGCGEEDGQR